MPPAPTLPTAPPYGGMPTPPPIYPPTGYTAYQAGAGMPAKSTTGTRKATLVLFWCASAASLLVGFVAYQRGNVLDDYLNGGNSLSDVRDADSRVAGLAFLMLALQIAAAIVLAVWSNRTVSNAKSRGADASSGLAAGGWFIPIGNYWVPWGQLRKAAARFGTVPGALLVWQLLFIGQAVLSVIARVVGNLDSVTGDEQAVSKLHNQGFLFIATAASMAVAAVCAGRAMKGIDELTSPTS